MFNNQNRDSIANGNIEDFSESWDSSGIFDTVKNCRDEIDSTRKTRNFQNRSGDRKSWMTFKISILLLHYYYLYYLYYYNIIIICIIYTNIIIICIIYILILLLL